MATSSRREPGRHSGSAVSSALLVPLAGGALGVVARDEIDVRAGRACGDHRALTDRAAAHHRDALAAAQSRAAQPVHHHRERLDEARVLHRDCGMQRHEAALGHHDLVGHAAVVRDAHHDAGAEIAEVVGAALAIRTDTARKNRLDRHGRVVGCDAGELVTECVAEREARVDQVQVRAADPGRSDPHAHAVAGRPRNVDHLDAPIVCAHRPHRGRSVTQRGARHPTTRNPKPRNPKRSRCGRYNPRWRAT